VIDKKLIFAGMVVCGLAAAVQAAEVVPVGDFSLMGGGSFYEGESSASGGNFRDALSGFNGPQFHIEADKQNFTRAQVQTESGI